MISRDEDMHTHEDPLPMGDAPALIAWLRAQAQGADLSAEADADPYGAAISRESASKLRAAAELIVTLPAANESSASMQELRDNQILIMEALALLLKNTQQAQALTLAVDLQRRARGLPFLVSTQEKHQSKSGRA